MALLIVETYDADFEQSLLGRILLSETAVSNLYTMGVASKHRPDLALPTEPSIPSEDVRRLRARLILSEALETIKGLGFRVQIPYGVSIIDDTQDVVFVSDHVPNLEEIIDGCCDLNYVSVGTLCAVGVADLPHERLVNKANNAKFPGGVATLDAGGKYLKPPGWMAPSHSTLLVKGLPNLRELSKRIIAWETGKVVVATFDPENVFERGEQGNRG